jgi:DNA-binding SARP family transcriptional activator
MSEGRWFTLLGPVTAACGGRELDLGTPQQKAVLAALLLRPGQHVPLHQLVDWLWDVDPPRTAEQMIRTYVYRLRKSLRAGVSADAIASVGTGYLVRVAPEELDMSVFRNQVEKAQQAKAAGDLATAHRLLREGLSLWTGDPLADLVGVPAEAARTRLRALQLDAVEQSLDLELELGRFGEAAYQLSELVAAHPLDERFARLLMRALNGSGRQADALAVYSDVRRRLADELGIDPGAALQETHVRILRAERPRESGNEQPVVRASSSTATATCPPCTQPTAGRSALVQGLGRGAHAAGLFAVRP